MYNFGIDFGSALEDLASALAEDLDRVNNADDARSVADRLIECTAGMSMNESVAFSSEVAAAHHRGRGEDLNVVVDNKDGHLIFTGPYLELQRFDWPFSPRSSDSCGNKLNCWIKQNPPKNLVK